MSTVKKIKTSISLSESTLQGLKQIAEAEDRSVSYILEKFAERLVIQEEPGKSDQNHDAAPVGGGGANEQEGRLHVIPTQKYPKPHRSHPRFGS